MSAHYLDIWPFRRMKPEATIAIGYCSECAAAGVAGAAGGEVANSW